MTGDTFSVIYLKISCYLKLPLTSFYKGVTGTRGDEMYSLHLETSCD